MATESTTEGDGQGTGKGQGTIDEDKAKQQHEPTRYIVLWAAVPDEDDEPLKYRQIANPDGEGGTYRSTNPETARRKALNDEKANQHPHLEQALERNGIILRSIPTASWGPAEKPPLKVETKRELQGSV